MEVANRLQEVREYYFSKKLREVAALKAAGKPIINLGIGSPDLLPPASVTSTLVSSLNHTNANSYQSYQGILELREAIATFYKTHFNVSLQATHEILPLLGSKEGIMHISLAFLNKGDQVLIPNPGYPTYTSVTKLVEAEPIYYSLKEKNNWLPNLELLEQKNLSKVKIMWLNYPHMPTGAIANSEFYYKIIAFAKKHDILLVNDNPYSFILNNTPTSILQIEPAKEVAIELNSLSKTFNMAGWRVGMVLGNEKFIAPILKVKSNIDSGMFYGIQKGAIAALKSDTSWFTTSNATYTKRRAIVWKIADKLNCKYAKHASGMFVWAKLPTSSNSETFIDHLLYQKSIFCTPGSIFGTNGEGYIRISLCANETILKEALSRL